MDKIQPTVDNMNQESEKWQKESENFRNSMPDPEEIEKEMNSAGTKKVK